MNQPLVEVGTRLGFPVWSWAPEWWEFLRLFGLQKHRLKTERYTATGELWHGMYSPHFVYPLQKLSKPLRRDLLRLAEQLYHLELPPEGLAFLTNMTALVPPKALISALATALRYVADDNTAAVHVPVSEFEEYFPLHADLARQRLLMNVYQNAHVTGRAMLMRMSDFVKLLPAALDAREAEWLRANYAYEHWDPEGYQIQTDILWGGDQSKENARVLPDPGPELVEVLFGPGEGYLVLDSAWVHGREELAEDCAPDRMHRLTFDTYDLLNSRCPTVKDSFA